MTNRYDLISGKDVVTNGEKKTYWTRVGTMFPSKKDDGFLVKLDVIPLPNKDGEIWIKASIPRERNGGEYPVKNGPTQRPLREEINDDIPF